MSRIHEALKKAELESSDDAVTAVQPVDRQTSAPPSRADVSRAADIVAHPRVKAEPSGRPVALRFEDISEHCARPQWVPVPLENVFANKTFGVEGAEQFRTLRSRLYQLREEKALRVLLVTSPISADGKTFVASNLARAIIRQSDRRVLLIDADLRCSSLHARIGAPASPGLGDYLSGTVDDMTVIQHGQEGGLYFIAGGKTTGNPSELLSSGRLKNLIDRVTPAFDWVIIDSPPCLPVADAMMVAELCDGVLLVVRAGTTPSKAAQKACHELKKRYVVGVVLNGVDEKALTYGSYYGRGGYGKAYSPDSIRIPLGEADV
jgi:protein-tyrosine kinase